MSLHHLRTTVLILCLYVYFSTAAEILKSSVIKDSSIVRQRRGLQVNQDRFDLYEGEKFTITCAVTDQDVSGGQPHLLVVPNLAGGNYKWPTPTLNIVRPNAYTLQSEITATAAFNENALRCQNRTDKKSGTDRIIFVSVRYLRIKTEMDRVFSFEESDGITVACSDFLLTNHDVQYRWEGDIINSFQRDQHLVGFCTDEQEGSHSITCVAGLVGDPTGLNTRRLNFTVNFPEILTVGGNRAATVNSQSHYRLTVYLVLILCLRSLL